MLDDSINNTRVDMKADHFNQNSPMTNQTTFEKMEKCVDILYEPNGDSIIDFDFLQFYGMQMETSYDPTIAIAPSFDATFAQSIQQSITPNEVMRLFAKVQWSNDA